MQTNLNMILCVQDNSAFITVGQLMLAAASLVVSIFAYRLAEKISFKKTIKDRQFDIVCQFVKSFSSSLIAISYKTSDGRHGISSFYLPQFRSSKFKTDFPEFFDSKNLIIQEDGMNHFNFVSLIGDPFLPRELFCEFKKIWYHTERKVDDPQSNYNEYIIISNHKAYDNPNYFMPKGIEFKDFESFFKFINNVMDKTNSWLDTHEATEMKFRDMECERESSM